MNIGIFGGSFDPPHIGHLILAQEASYQLRLDKVLWVVTSKPPHKRNISLTPIEIRTRLVEAAIKGEPEFELSRVDIDRAPPHYAIDTLRLIRVVYPMDRLIYLMGGDSLQDLPQWYEAQRFVDKCDGIGVMRRPNDEVDYGQLESILPGIRYKIQTINTPLIEISSHDIRGRIFEGRTYRYYLYPGVYKIIGEEKLYTRVSE